MMEVIHWAGRQVHPDITHEQLAIEIAQIRSMRFSGLSEKGLVVLCLLRGCRITGRESREELINHLKRQEGFFAKIRRKTRRWLGKRVEKMIGDPTQATPPPSQEPVNQPTGPVSGPRPQALREEVEDSGFFGGIANRVKRQADSYVNQKLDEIEARIDRKLDEIDRRLAEWRDKEIANRIRILKITLWASVFVAGVVFDLFVYSGGNETMEPTRPPASVHHAYLTYGPRQYYQKYGFSYRNPHEPIIRELIRQILLTWDPDCSFGLDLAAGSGEVTLAVRDVRPKSLLEGVDPYTHLLYTTRTGLPCLPLSFEDIAAGALRGRCYSVVFCSFALHLLEESRLPGLCWALGEVSDQWVILTPHKRPVIRPQWGWDLKHQMLFQRVRARFYQRTTKR
ncbi:MAG: hypothetical protein KatS3mg104_0630 [Phycisphaerae bacterium]|nr:MAG: hypothetical protein KatS3mg104_0630 [Phycisphaerae bacterium]